MGVASSQEDSVVDVLDATKSPAVVIIDLNGKIDSVNTAASRLFGVQVGSHELKGRDIRSLISPIEVTLPNGQSSSIESYGDLSKLSGHRLEGRAWKVCGVAPPFPVELGLTCTSNGMYELWIYDVTRAQPDQPESSQRRNSLMGNLYSDGVIIIDEAGIIRSFNPSACCIFGYEKGQVLGQNVSMLMPSPFSEHHDEYMQHYRSSGERKIIGRQRDVVAKRADGTCFPLGICVSESCEIADATCFVAVVADHTSQKRDVTSLQQDKSWLESVRLADHASLPTTTTSPSPSHRSSKLNVTSGLNLNLNLNLNWGLAIPRSISFTPRKPAVSPVVSSHRSRRDSSPCGRPRSASLYADKLDLSAL